MLKQSKIIKGLVAISTIFAMTVYYFLILGFATVSYAATLGRSNVEFESYFKDENGNKTKSIQATVNDEIYLYFSVDVLEEGYFNGKISINNSNFDISQEIVDSKITKIESNTIELNQVNNGEDNEFKVKINVKSEERYNLNLLDKESEIILQGTYITENIQKDIEKTSNVKLTLYSPYDKENQNSIKLSLLTNKVYNVNGENKRIVQLEVNNSLEGNSYPVKETNINVSAPKDVEEVYVYSRGTYLSNGLSDEQFSEDSYKYLEEQNLVQITLKNEIQTNENGDAFVKWNRDRSDLLIVTYVLDEKATLNETITASAEISLYDGYVSSLYTSVLKSSTELNIETEADGIITGLFNSNNDSIYKGKIYSGEDKTINTRTQVSINYVGVQNTLTIDTGKAYFQNISTNEETGERVKTNELEANMFIKRTIIEKSRLENILGENGTFVINRDGEQISFINKDTLKTLQELYDSEQEDKSMAQGYNVKMIIENKYVIIDYLEDVKNISFTIQNYEKQGLIYINNIKVIKNDTYSRAQLKEMNNLQFVENLNQTNNDTLNTDVELKETVTKANFKINNNKLQAGSVNPNVEFLVLLKTDDEKYDLYNNPYIEIELPQGIDSIKLNNVKTLYEDGLSLVNTETYTNEAGNKIIKIIMQGSQTSHQINSVQKGTYLVINADLELSNSVETSKAEVKLRCKNDADVIYDDNGEVIKELTYIRPVQEAESNPETQPQPNTTDDTTDINAIDLSNIGASQTLPEDSLTVTKTSSVQNEADVKERQIIIYNISIKNNTNTKLENITLKDKLPEEVVFAPYKTGYGYDSGYVEDSSITTYEQTGITIEAGETKEFQYSVIVKKDANNIGKTLTSNPVEVAIENYTNTFSSNNLENTIREGKIEVSIAFSKSSKVMLAEGDMYPYIIKVKNLTSEDLTNVVVTDELPKSIKYFIAHILGKDEEGEYNLFSEETTSDNVYYNEEKNVVTINLGTIPANEDKWIELDITVNKMDDKNETSRMIENSVEVTTDQTEKYTSNTESIKQAQELYEVTLKTNVEGTYIKEGEEFIYTITLKNLGDLPLSGDLLDELPDGVRGEKVIYKKTNEIVEEQDDDFEYGDLSDWDGQIEEIEWSEEDDRTSSEEENKEENEDNNEETNDSGKKFIDDELDSATEEELEDGYISSAIYNNKNVSLYADLNKGGTLVADVYVKAKELDEGIEQLEIRNKAEYEDKQSNEIYNIIIKNGDDDDDSDQGYDNLDDDNNSSGANGNSNNKGSISGLAWEDEDRNATRSNNEKLIPNIPVKLLNKETNQVIKSTKTNNEGAYSFTDLSNGNYIVQFEYDSTLYKLTDYKKTSVSEDRNSDVVGAFKEDENEKTSYGITNTIEVSNNSITNIDMGLIQAQQFDLKIENTVQKIDVTTSQGTKTKNYKNSALSKIEIRAKLLNGAKVNITYNIKVTNVSKVAGYATEITDSIQNEMKFDKNLNAGWEQKGNNLINTSLKDELINPGETKELKLVLTKQMTEDNTGTVTNTAKITASNSASMDKDINSQNDESKANTIISIGTGGTVIAITIVIIAIGIAILSYIFIYKKKKKIGIKEG